MVCPNCVSNQPAWAEKCLECGADLSFLRDHPARVGGAIWVSMLVGLALLLALFAAVFDQLMRGMFPVLGRPQAVVLAIAVTLSLLGARAWGALRDILIGRLKAPSR